MLKVRLNVGIVLAGAILVSFSLLAASASALLVRAPDGHVAGIMIRSGVSPATVPGSLASPRSPRAAAPSAGNLTFHGGVVLHTTSATPVFWDPSHAISPATRTLFEAYLTDTAHDSRLNGDVYGVGRQYPDATGFPDTGQTFTSAQAVTDEDAFPARDTTNCPDANFPTCLTDAQLQTELTKLIDVKHLPTGVGANAPVYLMVTPSNVNVCDAPDSCADPSSSNGFCAYHSNFVDGPHQVIYASIPLLDANKGCQADNTTPLQSPNASPADVAVDNMSHEYNESITDPVVNPPLPATDPTGWWNNTSGNEEADNCEAWGPTDDPLGGTNPNAYVPTLGGSEPDGTLFDQSINGGHFYTQSEWSNQDANCHSQPAADLTFNPAISGPSVIAPGSAATLDPSTSTAGSEFSSATWDFGDGSPTLFNRGEPQAVSHVFAAGSHIVSLTVVDGVGNLATATHTVVAASAPSPLFTAAPAPDGQGTLFDASASSDPNPGGSIVSYEWDFGDGTTGAGVTVTHAYAAPGNFTVTLTVTDNFGLRSSSSQSSFRHDSPNPSLNISPSVAAVGAPVSFDGSGSTDSTPGASITAYAWTFGDEAAATGAKTTHAYGKPGTYTATLTVTDSNGLQSEVTHPVTIIGSPTATMIVSPKHPAAGLAVHFDGSSSRDPSAKITRYSWSFGDGFSGRGPHRSHIYVHKGDYTVHLTATDANGLSSIATATVTVVPPEKISQTSLQKANGGLRLSLKLSGPGSLRIGSRHFKIRRARTVTVHFSLTKGQQRTVSQRHKLVYKVGIVFVPQAGKTVRETAKVTLRSGG